MNILRNPTRVMRRLLLASSLGLPAALLAQTTTSADTEPVTLEAFTVTGEKMGKTLQETTASVGFVSSTLIEDTKILNYADAFRLLGNARDSSFVDGGFLIRGVNSDGVGGVSNGAPLAGFYIDGVAQTQQGGRRGALGLWDVEQVEVFRGPQSTVTGRNSLAGAIFLRTKDPTFTREGAVRLGFADYDSIGGALAYSAPLTDTLAFRISVQASRADSTIEYPTPAWRTYDDADKFETYEDWQLRGKLLWQPFGRDGTKFLLGYSRAYTSTVLTDALGPTYDPNVNSIYDRKWAGFGLTSDVGFQARDGITDNASLEITHPLRGDLTLTALTTFTDALVRKPSLVSKRYAYGNEDEIEYSQEVRVNYTGQRIRGVAGIYALVGDESTQADQPNSGFTTRSRSLTQVDTENYALFGEMDYKLDSRFTLTAGGRIDSEKRDTAVETRTGAIPAGMSGAAGAPNYNRANVALTTLTNLNYSYDKTVFLPKAGVTYAFDPNHSLAFTVQRGYRGGGAGYSTALGRAYTWNPEYTINYELAYRSMSADQKFVFNANVFYADWDDMQIRFNGPIGSNIVLTTNAGEATWWGSEIEASWRPVSGLSFTASIGYVSTEFKSFITTSNINYTGARFPEAPEWDGSVAVAYKAGNGFFARCDVEYVGTFFSQILYVAQTPAIEAGGYTTVNPAIGWAGKRWSVTLYANNVLDKDYMTYNEPFNSASARGDKEDAATLGMPRVVGVSLDFKF